jgi:hypothetical protein
MPDDPVDAIGNRMVSSKDVQVNVNDQGALNSFRQSKRLLSLCWWNAHQIAQRIVNDSTEQRIELGNIRHRLTCGGTLEGSGKLDTPSAIETIVQFRQVHNGVDSINSDHGLIAVSIDNDGRIVNVYDSTKSVLGEVDKRTSNTSSPRDPKKAKKADTGRQFKKKVDKVAGSSKSSTLREFVGYDFSGNLGAVVHQKDVEVDFGRSLKKRYKVRVQLT